MRTPATTIPLPRALPALLVLALTSCATLGAGTQKVRVVTEPPGAAVAALEDEGRKELGASPVDYQRGYQAYRCSKAMWLLPVGTALGLGGAGFGIAYATTHRPNAAGKSAKMDAAWATGALGAALGLSLGIAVAAECLMKDGEVPEHKDARVIVEAHKEGFLPASATLKIPSKVEEIRLVLPPAPAPAEQ